MKCIIGWDDDLISQYRVCKSTITVDTMPTQNMFLPFKDGSTAFTMSRFNVPEMMQYHGWHLFCDSDFYFIEDVRKLLHYADSKYAVAVCKHPEYEPKSDLKMDGKQQTSYRRKNWSSLILWNCSHPSNRILRPPFIADCNPLWLHQFKWLKDEEIGEIPLEWNCLEGYYDCNDAKAIHYTDGVPLFDKYKNTPHAKLWLDRHELLLR